MIYDKAKPRVEALKLEIKIKEYIISNTMQKLHKAL